MGRVCTLGWWGACDQYLDSGQCDHLHSSGQCLQEELGGSVGFANTYAATFRLGVHLLQPTATYGWYLGGVCGLQVTATAKAVLAVSVLLYGYKVKRILALVS